MQFGHPIPDCTPIRSWGARAIYQRGNIDLLHDRQSYVGDDDQSFVKWLNERALPWLRAEVKRIGLGSDDPQELVLHEFKYELRASTHSSYGYLYIGAVEHTLVECEPRKNTATGAEERVVSIRDTKFVVDDGIVPVGSEGKVNVNGIGPAKVVGYFNEKYGDDFKLACLMVVMLDPPDWWVSQTQQREVEKLVKSGDMPAKRGTKPEHGVPSPTALKEWKSKWKPSPCPIWPNDFKVVDKAAA